MRRSRMKIATAVAMALLVALLSHACSAAFKGPEEHTRTLTGHVFGHQNQPLSKAIVYLKNTKSLAIKTYISDADGGYHFPGLSPNVDYEVYAEHDGARSDTKTLSAFDNRKQVNITLRIN